MTTASDNQELSPVKRALVEIRELKARLAELEGAMREPVAIVGLGIRAPGGVRDAATFAELLWNGVDAITAIPPDRWDRDAWFDEDQDHPGKMYSREGGFVDEVDRFDAEFFGISPLEAASMDPQQRLLLELAWHALEDAGHSPAGLKGSRTGVYIGIANGDYGRGLLSRADLIDPYFSPGNAYSVASGRIAYLLGLHGPAISIDTACSSSLVALHLACQSLRSGECDLALAGGVNLILTPELHVNFCKAGMMSRAGRCRTFDAAADGYVRGEGGAIVVLRRLRDALADGDRVLALIRGSAVNQDGRSNGLTAPNGPAQEAVLRAALASAGVTAPMVGYVETHGTGTSLGDPIEVNALGAVYAEGRDPSTPLAIGSVKTNIGHLEAAAGIAGLVKTVLALQRREIPPHLHLASLNPHVDWQALPLTIPTEVTAWAPIGGRRLAGVSSFGFSGTNAHLVLEEAPAPLARTDRELLVRPMQILTASARDAGGLRAQVASYREALHQPPMSGQDAALADFCFTANAGRAHSARRLAVQGRDVAQIDAALAAWQQGQANASLIENGDGCSGAAGGAPRVAFLFPGQGPQYVGMGRQLYRTSAVFREAFDRCADILDELLPKPIRPIVFEPTEPAGDLDETAYAQPAIFAIAYSLAAVWRAWGIEPVAVMGHSFGEYAAACVAGAVSLADAARMVATRGRLAQALPRDGAMAVIEAPERDVLQAIARYPERIAVSAINGAVNTVISGDREIVAEVASTFAARGARIKPLRISHAFHSPLMDPVLDEFEAALADVSFSEPRVALVSNLSGRLAGLETIGQASYWRRHMRDPVRFADSIEALSAQGVTHYIEMSPHPVLLGMGAEVIGGATWLASLREARDDWSSMLESLQQLYCDGAAIDWTGFEDGAARRRLALPTYPFQRKRHWIDAGASVPAGIPAARDRWGVLSQALDRQAERGPIGLDAASYPAKWECLARLTRAHAALTLRGLGAFGSPGERRSVDEVIAATGIGTTYRHLVERWLLALARDGQLRQEAAGVFVADAALAQPDLQALWAEADRRFADNPQLLAYVRHCGTLVTDVLRGRESPLETLFPGGSFDLAQALYEESATMRYVNQLAATAFEVLGNLTPAGRILRVLEIGGGTGGTTSSLLPVLPSDRTRYRFSDVSEVFLERARSRFGRHRWVEFGLFDLEQTHASQGYEPASFDLIVAANAVHAARDLRAALAGLQTLLAPGGVLVLIESTTHLAYFDMTTGLIEGWQHFADDLRDDNPLLAPQAWVVALTDAGFAEAQAWPDADSVATCLGQHVIVARAPGDEAAAGVAMAGVVESRLDAAGGEAAIPPAAADSWRARLAEAMPVERIELLRDLVCGQVMTALRLDPSSTPARHDRLMDLGMDSLMAVRLRNALIRALELQQPLPSTLIFDYPTIDAIAVHLDQRLFAGDAPPPAAARASPAPAAEPLSPEAVAALSDDEIERLLDERARNP